MVRGVCCCWVCLQQLSINPQSHWVIVNCIEDGAFWMRFCLLLLLVGIGKIQEEFRQHTTAMLDCNPRFTYSRGWNPRRWGNSPGPRGKHFYPSLGFCYTGPP